MKLAEYIKQQIEKSNADEILIDIGLNKDMAVDDNSPSRVRFTIKKKGKVG